MKADNKITHCSNCGKEIDSEKVVLRSMIRLWSIGGSERFIQSGFCSKECATQDMAEAMKED